MIRCLNCQHQELPGALFCSECGAQLVTVDALTTHNLEKVHSDTLNSNILFKTIPEAEIKPDIVSTAIGVEAVMSLQMIETGRTIHLSGKPEFSLGRIAEGQPILPDVDLSEFEAYSQGVSRLHAAIKVGSQRVSIMDLGSANGTRVNGQKIVPHVDYPIKHGDMVALGKLKIQIIIQK
ncbi:MAG: FHA domain-containing protein [Bellilinea sp.]|jgi:hypothetical protein